MQYLSRKYHGVAPSMILVHTASITDRW